jgi:hypothetical protein
MTYQLGWKKIKLFFKSNNFNKDEDILKNDIGLYTVYNVMFFIYVSILFIPASIIQYKIDPFYDTPNTTLNKIVLYSFIGSLTSYYYTNAYKYGQTIKTNYPMVTSRIESASLISTLFITLMTGTIIFNVQIGIAITLIIISSV